MLPPGPQNPGTSRSRSPQELQPFLDQREILIKVALRITGCPSRAEDVLQDAYFRLQGAPLSTLSEKARLSYIFRVVRNLAIDYYRKQHVEQRHAGPEEESLEVAQNSSASPEVIHAHHETLHQVVTALSEVPGRSRYAFEMYRIHGKPQKEIARELGVSPTLVNFMIRDTLVHCRKRVEKYI